MYRFFDMIEAFVVVLVVAKYNGGFSHDHGGRHVVHNTVLVLVLRV